MKRATSSSSISSPSPAELEQTPATFPDGPNVAPGGPDDTVAKPSAREERIRQAAYAIAEKRGFSVDRAVDDWLEAERQVDNEPPEPR